MTKFTHWYHKYFDRTIYNFAVLLTKSHFWTSKFKSFEKENSVQTLVWSSGCCSCSCLGQSRTRKPKPSDRFPISVDDITHKTVRYYVYFLKQWHSKRQMHATMQILVEAILAYILHTLSIQYCHYEGLVQIEPQHKSTYTIFLIFKSGLNTAKIGSETNYLCTHWLHILYMFLY